MALAGTQGGPEKYDMFLRYGAPPTAAKWDWKAEVRIQYTVGWSDFPLFAIYKIGPNAADQVYFYEVNLNIFLLQYFKEQLSKRKFVIQIFARIFFRPPKIIPLYSTVKEKKKIIIKRKKVNYSKMSTLSTVS